MDISIHAPRTGSDGCASLRSLIWRISIHAPRTGSDGKPLPADHVPLIFQSTLPARGATLNPLEDNGRVIISIHAPRTGSDRDAVAHGWSHGHFNPRSPHGERQGLRARNGGKQYFNPRSPHGERPSFRRGVPGLIWISIHAPRTGSDRRGQLRVRPPRYFNPRSPHGERLLFRALQRAHIVISIHAPRTGSDNCTAPRLPPRGTFQSTLPARGATRMTTFSGFGWMRFQSTLPARGATLLFRALQRAHIVISIHAPRTGSDTSKSLCAGDLCRFQSTLPARGATRACAAAAA